MAPATRRDRRRKPRKSDVTCVLSVPVTHCCAAQPGEQHFVTVVLGKGRILAARATCPNDPKAGTLTGLGVDHCRAAARAVVSLANTAPYCQPEGDVEKVLGRAFASRDLLSSLITGPARNAQRARGERKLVAEANPDTLGILGRDARLTRALQHADARFEMFGVLGGTRLMAGGERAVAERDAAGVWRTLPADTYPRWWTAAGSTTSKDDTRIFCLACQTPVAKAPIRHNRVPARAEAHLETDRHRNRAFAAAKDACAWLNKLARQPRHLAWLAEFGPKADEEETYARV